MTLLATAPLFVPRSVPAADTPTGPVSSMPVGVDLPADFDASRQYVIPGCAGGELERYEFPAGPANPNSRTLADVVREVAERAA